jgi:hypothetical protein
MCKTLSELTSRRVRSGSSEQYRDNLCEPDHVTGFSLPSVRPAFLFYTGSDEMEI